MPDQGTVFDKDNGTPTPDPDAGVVNTQPSPNVFNEKLNVIKNEDGTPKYDSVPKALDALAQSQLHIKKLEEENLASSTELADLRVAAAKHQTVEEVVARITANNGVVQDTPQPVVDEQAVANYVRNAMNADRADLQKQTNVAEVQNALVSQYGDKAADVITAKAIELGVSNDTLKAMSADNPKVVLALFGSQSPSNDSMTSTSIHMGADQPKDIPLERPKKSLLAGATSKDQSDFMAEVTKRIHEKHNVET